MQGYQLQSGLVYPPTINTHPNHSPYGGIAATSNDHHHHDDDEQPPRSAESNTPSNSAAIVTNGSPNNTNNGTKPQATFLTKLYALLENPANMHMIRWDDAGEHIIVERPEQLALHVLPSVYRQSRFASFSRQLNIYGFMRKVNLRNVDPSIDDPDASTWSHPTLNRRSSPDVVANFKRRVPPRLPKSRKPPIQPPHHLHHANSDLSAGPRSAIGPGPAIPLSVPASVAQSAMPGGAAWRGRSRGFSAPSMPNGYPLSNASSSPWQHTPPPPSIQSQHTIPPPGQHHLYQGHRALPPLTVPQDTPPPLGSYNSPSSYSSHPITPADDTPHAFYPHHRSDHFGSYYQDSSSSNPPSLPPPQGSWAYSPSSTQSHSGSLSSLLNPNPSVGVTGGNAGSGRYGLPGYSSSSNPSLSPDSRPTTGYSVASSMSSLTYDAEATPGPPDFRPSSSHSHSHSHSHTHRPLSPPRPHSKQGYGTTPPGSSSGPQQGGSPGVQRTRRHSQAVSPYPSPYDADHLMRPGTSPALHSSGSLHSNLSGDENEGAGLPRVKSMMSLSSNDTSSYNPAQADFAYTTQHVGMDQSADRWSAARPGTGHSSVGTPSVDG